MNNEKLEIINVINKLKTPKLLVIGDFAIDEMIYGKTARISREAPVLILKHAETKIILGAASNAAHNISALNGGKVKVIGVCGKDLYAPIMKKAFKDANVDCSLIVEDKDRPTTTKSRISGFSTQSVKQQIVRIDRELNEPVCKKTEDKIISNIKKAVPDCDGILLSDYNIGVLTDNVINCAIEEANRYGKIITVDAQENLGRYKGVTCLTPNQPDTEKAVGYEIKTKEDAIRAGKDLLKITNAKMMLLTRGDEGMMVFYDDKYFNIPAFNKTDVFDVTGAGDTVVAAFTLALAAGATPKQAATVGNLAASIVIRQFGCATTSLAEMIEVWENLETEI